MISPPTHSPYSPSGPPLQRPAPRIPILLGVLGLFSLGACITSTSSQPVGLDRAIITSIPVSRAWVVQESAKTVGSVVRYSERGSDGRFLYVVRNLWDQDLGVIDEQGRAWRRVPHEDDHWIGTGTIVQGVRQILDTGPDTQMLELPIEAVEGATATARAG